MAKNYFGVTDTGKRRTNNEDTFIAEKLNRQFITACVIDGLGGYEGGEVASAVAKDAIIKTLSQPHSNVPDLLKNAITFANSSIQKEKEKKPEYNSMACVVTLALTDINNNKFYYAHVGDTRLYLLRDKSLVKITKDQSFVGFLEDNGRITEEEAMQHPKRNEINKALGFDSGINTDDYIEIGDSPFLPGDVLLLCSDGLSDMINSATMASILNTNKSIEQKGAALIQAANDAGGDDNITVVLVHNNKQQLKQTAVKPLIQKKENTEAVTAIETPESDDSVNNYPAKKTTIIIPALSVLLVCALILAGFFYYQLRHKKETIAAVTAIPVITKKRNAFEQALNDSINQPLSQTVNISADLNQQPIIISDTIFINKDSLTIHGNGAVIKSDSSFNGPAFVLAENCRYVVLDSLSFSNFNVAILIPQSGIRLRNIRFIDCNIPVIQQYNFSANTPVTRTLQGNLFSTDSLPK
jgi:serine/threonine protein phosphatase PrpC